MTSVAFLSDIHGNLPALEAVVADVRACAPDAVYVLGDMVNGCPWSPEVLDLLAGLGWPMLLGNHDDAVMQLGTARMEPRYAHRDRYAALWWTRERLNGPHLELMQRLPLELALTFPDASALQLLHGIPGNFFIGIRPDAPEEWAVRRLRPVAAETVLAGHTHAPMDRRFARSPAGAAGRSWRVINTGSVGAPYDGDPRPSYAWLEGSAAGWRAETRRVDYDMAAVDAGFRQSSLLVEGGPMGEMFRRSVLSGLPWVADFAWWVREQPSDVLADMGEALRRYDAQHGPGRWAFPYA